MFSTPERLLEGVVLRDPMDPVCFIIFVLLCKVCEQQKMSQNFFEIIQSLGKIVFSLANIPIGIGYQTDRGTSIVRISDVRWRRSCVI